MDDLIFNRAVFNAHYNCALYDIDSIPLAERQHPIHSAYLFFVSLFLEILCGLCLYAISRPHLIRLPSYKLMFALALSEMTELVLAGIAEAIVSLSGIVYCSNPTLMFFMGASGTGIWYFEGQMSILLAFNRCLILYDAHCAKRLFGRYKVVLYIIAVIFSAIFMVGCGPPVLYSGAGGGIFYDPHVGYRAPDPYFFNKLHFIFNHTVPVTLIGIYTVFGVLIYRQHKNGQQRPISKTEMSIFFQISIICFLTIIPCGLYAYASYFEQNKFLVAIKDDSYLLYLGSPAFVYLLLNKSIRREVLKLSRRLFKNRYVATIMNQFPTGLRMTKYEEQLGADLIEHGLAGHNKAKYKMEKPLTTE